jgi:hypothetical protein
MWDVDSRNLGAFLRVSVREVRRAGIFLRVRDVVLRGRASRSRAWLWMHGRRPSLL